MTIIGIYGIENRIENKWYVGQSINLYKRLGGHLFAYVEEIEREVGKCG